MEDNPLQGGQGYFALPIDLPQIIQRQEEHDILPHKEEIVVLLL